MPRGEIGPNAALPCALQQTAAAAAEPHQHAGGAGAAEATLAKHRLHRSPEVFRREAAFASLGPHVQGEVGAARTDVALQKQLRVRRGRRESRD
jgi:hypothetical protein